MPLQATSGAASYDAFGGGVPVIPNYIEEVFSTYLYTGTGASNTITNNIDLSTKGGLVWIKQRNAAVEHFLYDTARGVTKSLSSDDTTFEYTNVDTLTAFGTNGFTLGSSNFVNGITSAPRNYVSWTFRKSPKFFDVVTYTGDGTSSRNITHNLGSVPGCIIVKATSAVANWYVYHRSTGNQGVTLLNTTNAVFTGQADAWNSTTPTASVFSIGNAVAVNDTGVTYVAYLFAHNAGGFGLTGTDNVISCGSYTGNGSAGQQITLGYEPQFIIIKRSDGVDTWRMYDTMRGMGVDGQSKTLQPNAQNNESSDTYPYVNATGFTTGTITSGTYIYIAIRRGPMKVPTDGTKVYTSASRTGTPSVIPRWTAGFPVDWALRKSDVTTGGGDWQAGDRLRGAVQLKPNLTEAESAASPLYTFDSMTGYSSLGIAGSDTADRSWMFRRAPGFFDEVCYTGTGVATTQTHNLGVMPQLAIIKTRSSVIDWIVFQYPSSTERQKLVLNTNDPSTGIVGSLLATSTYFSIGSNSNFGNQSGDNYVAYLFATCAGVSKVGSYTGTATTKQIDCGFTAGARFVLIKRTDSAGDWVLWDSSRGMVAGTDPRLALNSTAAEVNANWVYTTTGGFQIVTSDAAVNASGGSYIFLSIA